MRRDGSAAVHAAENDPGPWSGYHKLPRRERLRLLAARARLNPAELGTLAATSALPHEMSEAFVENSLGSFPLPLGLAVNFIVDGQAAVIPMAIEESSVVAAASHGAKLVAAGGGFRTEVGPAIAIGQVELRGVRNPAAAKAVLARRKRAWIAALNSSIPKMVVRGGGVTGIETRAVGKGRLVLHVLVDTQEAMGANVVNSLCETLAPMAAAELHASVGLRIVSNLASARLVTARATIPETALGGRDAVRAIVAANDFARADPYRAATHNKGIMNGVDAVLVATGNDWRAAEAGAHAYAAHGGRYTSLTSYRVGPRGALVASLTMPLSLGVVGGVTRLHPTARVVLKVMGAPDARRLAALVASVGLAQNLAALKALAGEGIQKGHMALHQANLDLAGADGA
jgi:hydroxymethylglutaryl-CoA reductase